MDGFPKVSIIEGNTKAAAQGNRWQDVVNALVMIRKGAQSIKQVSIKCEQDWKKSIASVVVFPHHLPPPPPRCPCPPPHPTPPCPPPPPPCCCPHLLLVLLVIVVLLLLIIAVVIVGCHLFANVDDWTWKIQYLFREKSSASAPKHANVYGWV